MTVYELLIIVHVIGTVLGVGAATFAEIHYTRFNADDIVTDDEKQTLAVTYTVMRAGLFLLVISGFGMLLHFRLTENVTALMSPVLWAKLTIVGILVGNALLLQMRAIPLSIGAAVSLTSWYAALVLGSIGKIDASYMGILAYYALAIVLVGVSLRAIRSYLHAPTRI
jgi:hypothetical protein